MTADPSCDQTIETPQRETHLSVARDRSDGDRARMGRIEVFARYELTRTRGLTGKSRLFRLRSLVSMTPTEPNRTVPAPRVGWRLPEPPTGWRGALLRVGHGRAVALITAGSVLASLVITWVVTQLPGGGDDPLWVFGTAAAVPLLVAPLASHTTIGLLYEVEQARALLLHAAIRDPLTNVFNRRYLMARLDEEVLRARRTQQPLSLLMVDIDRFKAINDEHGHAAGDATLERIAVGITETVRPYDLVARHGGEEFVVLMPGADLAEAGAAAERVRAVIASLPMPPDAPRAVTASVGFSSLAEDQPSPLLQRADRAMYAAKRAGRNCCVGLAPDAPAAP